MKLAPPVIVENLSVCSQAVRLRGQLHGATVEVYVDGQPQPVAKGVADWSDQWFGLLPGAPLAAGQVVRALQRLGPDVSPRTSQGVAVQNRSSGAPQFAAPLTACSQLAVVTGLAPGATVTIRDAATIVIGSSAPAGTRAEVALSRVVGNSEQLRARMDPCGGTPSPEVLSLPAQPMALRGTLEAPVLAEPLQQCIRTIHFGRTIPGAILNLERRGEVIFWPCTATELRGRIDPPLVAGETVTFWLEAPSAVCEALPSNKMTATVSTAPPGRPVILTPPCPGTRMITVAGLTDSATVTVRADAQEVCVFGASGGSQDVDLGGFALSIGQVVTATQVLCDVASAPSVGLPVTNPAERFASSFTDDLVACGLAIRLQDVLPGTFVEVLSRLTRGRIGWTVVNDETTVDIPLSPPLIIDDDVTVTFSGCGGGTLRAHVGPPVDLPPPTVQPPTERDRSVYVSNLAAGSMVDVFVDGRWAGGTPSGGRDIRVGVPTPLQTGQTVYAYVRLCSEQRSSDSVVVKAAPDIVWSQVSQSGIAVGGGHFHSGRVTAIVVLEGGALLVGTEAGGAWTISPGATAVPLSTNWTDARVLALARGPRGPNHFYCGTPNVLLETDTTALVPTLAWKAVDGFSSAVPTNPFPTPPINDLVVVPSKNIVVIATTNGVWWATIPATPGVGYSWSTNALVQKGVFTALTLGPNDSIVSCRIGAPGSGLFVGSWTGASLNWSNTTPGLSGPPPDARLTAAVSAMGGAKLASCQSDRTRVCAALQNRADDTWLAILRSDDGGATWSIPYADPLLRYFKPGGTVDLGFDAARTMSIGVHPFNKDTVLLASRRRGILGSTDGGATWDINRWKVIDKDSFHGDSLRLVFDPTDPSGNSIVVGCDGGVFVSKDLGVTFDTSYNEHFPTLMFDQSSSPSAPALSASTAYPGLLVAALQDNGNVFLTGPGQPWRQLFDGGDGNRALFVTPNVVLRGGNDNLGLKWARWDGAKFTDPVPFKPPAYGGLFLPRLANIPYARYQDPGSGALMRAIAGDDAGDVYGLFDWGVGHNPPNERFYWKKLGHLPAGVSGVGSYNGRIVLVGTGGPKVYRLDTPTGVATELSLPPNLSNNPFRWPTMATATVAFGVATGAVFVTTNLATWTLLASPPNAGIEVIAIDRSLDPVGLFAAGPTGAWYSRDLGSTWLPTKGLPRRPQANHLEIVDNGPAGRWIHLATWNWSAWRAQLA